MASNKQEFKGKNIDEAIALACQDFEANQNELDIEVLTTGSTGIFGLGRKKAVILASRKVSADEVAADADSSVKEKRHHGRNPNDSTRADSETLDKAAGRAKPRRQEARKKDSHDRSPGRSTSVKLGSSRQDRASAAVRFDDLPSHPPTQEVLAEIKDLTETVLRLMGLEAKVTMSVDGHKVAVHILGGDNHEVIVGREGSTLDAMQYLLRKIVSQKIPEKISLSLDAGTYRQDRQNELEQLALELAQKVKETGKSQMISALNPAERRMVHVILQEDTAIRSASIGEGLFKKVRIYLPGKGRKKSGRSGGDPSGQAE